VHLEERRGQLVGHDVENVGLCGVGVQRHPVWARGAGPDVLSRGLRNRVEIGGHGGQLGGGWTTLSW
jgi:hypothetical protein